VLDGFENDRMESQTEPSSVWSTIQDSSPLSG
jgi:hypothetical protein